jgi:hypothetical protein
MNCRRRIPAGIVSVRVLALLIFLVAVPANSYLVNLAAPNQPIHWSLHSFPIQWNINPSASGVQISGSQPVTAVMQAAFNTWTAAPNTNLPVSQGSNSSVTSESNSPGTINLVCFVCSGGDFDEGTDTLAVTLFTYATASGQSDLHGGKTQFAGQMLKADILFNPAVAFTTDSGAATGSVFDLQTVATHEVGHFFGLDHSAVVNAVMFPFSAGLRQQLSYDDVAAISSLYPGNQTVGTGVIQGTVRFQDGGGVFGAHVFADSITGTNGYGGNIRSGPIGALTLPDGTYTLTGLPADSYTITVQPLNGPVTNGQIGSYASVFGQTTVQTDFTARQH